MKTHLRKILVLVVLAATVTGLGVAAFVSAGGDESASTLSKQSNTEGSAQSAAVPSPFQKERSDVKVAAPSEAQRDKASCIDQPQVTKFTQSKDKSWVVALVDPNRSMGPRCPLMAPGANCEVYFKGGWSLTETPTGSLVFQVFENESKKPVRSPEAGPVPNTGRFSINTKLTYTVGKDAWRATFRVVLKDAIGRAVASSYPQSVRLPACFALREK